MVLSGAVVAAFAVVLVDVDAVVLVDVVVAVVAAVVVECVLFALFLKTFLGRVN